MSSHEQAQQIINKRASWLKRRAILQEQAQQSLIAAVNGSFFTADATTIGLVKALIDSGLEQAVILDQQGLPCQIEDLASLLKTLIAHNQSSLNLYHQQYAELVKQHRGR